MHYQISSNPDGGLSYDVSSDTGLPQSAGFGMTHYAGFSLQEAFASATASGLQMTEQQQLWFKALSDRCVGDFILTVDVFPDAESCANQLSILRDCQDFDIDQELWDLCLNALTICHAFAYTDSQTGFYDFIAQDLETCLGAAHETIFESED